MTIEKLHSNVYYDQADFFKKFNELIDAVNSIMAIIEQLTLSDVIGERFANIVDDAVEKKLNEELELLPCPFCLYVAQFKGVGSYHTVTCTNNECIASDNTSKFIDKSFAMKAWNKRRID